MSALTPKAFLTTLPPEIIGFIIPDPTAIRGVDVADSNPKTQRWLAIKPKWSTSEEGHRRSREVERAVQMLRALSQTCRLLRALALPRLWKVTHVKTVDELGRLRQTLRISPSVAQHIKSFCFLWKMDGDIWSFEEYEEEEGTFLELAFRNRWLMWEVLRQKLGCEIERRGGDGRAYFVYDEDEYYEPWAPKNVVVGEPRERGPTYSGPDGSGDDRLIENAEQFISSMSEILVQLVRLETFGWDTPMTPIPAKAFKTLSELKLSSLRLDMSKRQGNTHAFAFWKLALNLTTLSFDFEDWYFDDPDVDVQESKEADLASFELPPTTDLVLTHEARRLLHCSIASRTIATAARGGHLKSLIGVAEFPERPFAVRTLLPCWIHVTDWGGVEKNVGDWASAAASLRPLLAHASLWYGRVSSSVPRLDRSFTREDIQGLQLYFTGPGEFKKEPYYWHGEPKHILRYLPWLMDVELAEQVADAWNSVLERGEANVHRCVCVRCKGVSDDTGASSGSTERD